jgi:ketosteroid isomerase-like protein
MRTVLVGAGLALAIAACGGSESPEAQRIRMKRESDAAKGAFEQGMAKYVQWFEAGQIDSVMTLYAADARVMEAGAPPAQGLAAIRAGLANQSEVPGEYRLGIIVDAASANGPLAIQRGTWRLGFTPNTRSPKDAKTWLMEGTYLIHMHQVAGKWLIMDDLANAGQETSRRGGSFRGSRHRISS